MTTEEEPTQRPYGHQFGGWATEEIGAFIKGLVYAETGGDMAEIMSVETLKSLLAKMENPTGPPESTGGVATMPGMPSRAEFIDAISQAAEHKFKTSFAGHSQAVAHQIAIDVMPFMEEGFDRLRRAEITLTELNDLMSKMVIVAAASTLAAVQNVGLK